MSCTKFKSSALNSVT